MGEVEGVMGNSGWRWTSKLRKGYEYLREVWDVGCVLGMEEQWIGEEVGRRDEI